MSVRLVKSLKQLFSMRNHTKTYCSTSSSLPAYAFGVIRGYKAVGKM